MQLCTVGLLLSFLSASGATGEDDSKPPEKNSRKLNLSVQECVERALRYNSDLAAQSYTEQASAAGIQEARGTFDPLFSSNLQYYRSHVETDNSFVAGSTPSYLIENRKFDMSLAQTLETGGTYNLSFNENRRWTLHSGSGAFSFNPTVSSALQLTVAQPLLRGAWTTVTRAPVETAKMLYDQAKQLYGEKILQVIYSVHAAYWDLVFAQEDLSVKKFALDLAQKLLEINQKKVKEGVSAPVEVLQAETEIATRREALITAQNNLKSAQDNLKQLIFPFEHDHEWDLEIVPNSPIPTSDEKDIPPWESAVETAFQYRPDLIRLRSDLRTKELALDVAENALLPQLNLLASGSSAGLDSGVQDSLHDIFGTDFPTYSVGLNFQIPIGNLAAKGRFLEAKANRGASVQTLKAQEKIATREVRDAIRNLHFVRERIVATKKSRELATKQLEAEERKFEVGLSTNFQVLEFQQELVQALTNERQAQLDHAKALINLEKVQGVLKP